MSVHEIDWTTYSSALIRSNVTVSAGKHFILLWSIKVIVFMINLLFSFKNLFICSQYLFFFLFVVVGFDY